MSEFKTYREGNAKVLRWKIQQNTKIQYFQDTIVRSPTEPPKGNSVFFMVRFFEYVDIVFFTAQ